MTKLTIRSVFAAISLLAPAALVVRADTSSILQFSVPFAFHAGSADLPAGTYEVSEYGNNIVMIRGIGTPTAVVVAAYPLKDGLANAATRVTFRRHDGKYFLDTIQAGTGRVLGLTFAAK